MRSEHFLVFSLKVIFFLIKLILDLTGESKKLQDQLDELKKTVQKLQQELSSCLETGEGRSSNRTILSSDVVNKNSLPRMSSRSSSSVSHPKSDSQDDDHDVHEDSFQGSEGSDVLRERKDSDQYERERISSKSFVASNERDNDLDLNPEQG